MLNRGVRWLAFLLVASFALPVVLVAAPVAAEPGSFVQHRLVRSNEVSADALLERASRASYQRVFPPDERTRVTPTTQLPAAAIVLLVGEFSTGVMVTCSGTLVGRDVVLTSAHCLYASEFGGWVDVLVVVPGADRTGTQVVAPFGTTRGVEMAVPRGWVELGEPVAFDIGVVTLAEPLGERAGTLALTSLSDEELNHVSYTAFGYPGDKPFGTLWMAPGQGLVPVGPALLGLQADLVEGMSGGPLVTADGWAVFGIVSFETLSANFARRVTPDVLTFVEDFCADVGCTVQPAPIPPPTPPVPPPSTPPPTPHETLSFVSVQPARWSTVLPGPVSFSVTVSSPRPLAELVLRVAGQEARSREPTVTVTAHLDPGNHPVEAIARDVDGRELRTVWDVVASWDLADGPWFDSRGQPRAEAINATARALVEAFRWHLYGMSWDGVDHRGDLPTHAAELRPGEPVPVLVTENGFDRQATEATLRALVEAFRWHLYGISWDGAPHPEVPTHGATVLSPEPVGPWFAPDGQPRPEEITRTLRSLVEAFRWHLYGATWDGRPRSDMPTHAAGRW